MTPESILDSLQRRGFEFSVRGDALRVRPADRMTGEIRALLRMHKPALIHLIQARPADWRGRLTPAERAIVGDAAPPPEFVQAVLAARAALGGEIVSIRQPPRPDDLPSDWREQWEELRAIYEIQYGATREYAEFAALRDVLAMMKDGGESAGRTGPAHPPIDGSCIKRNNGVQ